MTSAQRIIRKISQQSIVLQVLKKNTPTVIPLSPVVITFFILKEIIFRLTMMIITPIDKKQKIDNHHSCETANGKICNIWLSNTTKKMKKRKLVMLFAGKSILSDYNGNHKNCDVITVDYCENTKLIRQLINSGVEMIIRIIAAGYKTYNIAIAGHCLGAAIAVQVLKIINEKKYIKDGQVFGAYYSYKSFTKLFYKNITLNTVSILKKELPVKNICIIGNEFDITGKRECLRKYIDENIEDFKNISVTTIKLYDHRYIHNCQTIIDNAFYFLTNKIGKIKI